MKCLVCTRNFIDKNDLRKHYVVQHRVNDKNHFFNALFKKNSGNFSIRKCYRCDRLITSSFHEVQHNFINHYQKGGEISIENRPVNKTTDGSIVKFTIDYDSDKNSYDFTDTSNMLEEFFEVVDTNFVTDEKIELFSMRNYQPPPEDLNNVTGLYDLRIWSTPVYVGNFFNGFIKTSLKMTLRRGSY